MAKKKNRTQTTKTNPETKTSPKKEYIVQANDLGGGVEFPAGVVHEPGAVLMLTDEDAAGFADGLIKPNEDTGLAKTSIPKEGEQEVNPATGEPVGEVTTTPTLGNEQQPERNNSIPKVNHPNEEEVAARELKGAEEVVVGSPTDHELPTYDHSLKAQLTPDEAIGWAMTQGQPMRAIQRLKRDRRLTNVTGTLAKAKEQGLE